MEAIQVTDYDVLADETAPGAYDLGGPNTGHVGNRRFGVLLEMYQEAFEVSRRLQKGEECRKIAQRIVDVTCHKDVSTIVTKGRFLVRPAIPAAEAAAATNGERKGEGGGDWIALDEEGAVGLVRHVLSNPAVASDGSDDGGGAVGGKC